jgi:plastocyanin
MLAGVAGAALAVVPALAADQTVTATGQNTFTPSTVTIEVGQAVHVHNGGGYHNVRWEDRSAAERSPSITAWTSDRRFDAAGMFRFFCEVHGAAGGQGMSGVVVVKAPAGAPTPTAIAPTLAAQRVRARFCTRKGRACPRPGIVLELAVTGADAVAGELARRPLRHARGAAYKADGTVALPARSGRVTFLRRADGTRIGAGDYRLSLHATGPGGASSAVAVHFFVGRS